ncbi:hypothetical protein QBZ16_001786 [Prototheca wickerhamii]|uniref:Uncharacterized protein n=1 Tax=Prototheca wickerhamii TaxID=3111 RepID=A0AAD9MK43_PROWI|nr:hypothetical protein QBZ16_001786 [Prototheca wickerhamii]
MGIGISFPGVSRVNPSAYPDDVRWTITEYGRNLVEAFRSNKHVYAVMAGTRPEWLRRDIKVNRQSAEGLFDRSFPPTPITREKVARLVHKPIPIYCVPDPSEEVVFVCRLMALRKDGPGRMKYEWDVPIVRCGGSDRVEIARRIVQKLDELYSGGREYTALDVSKWLVKGGDPPTPVPKELYHPLKDDAKPKEAKSPASAPAKSSKPATEEPATASNEPPSLAATARRRLFASVSALHGAPGLLDDAPALPLRSRLASTAPNSPVSARAYEAGNGTAVLLQGNALPLPESRLRIQGPSREASIDEDGDEGDDRRVRDLKRRASSPEASRDRDAGPDARPAKRPALEPRSPRLEGERLWEPGMPKPLALRPLRRSPAPDERAATEALPITSASFPTGRVPRSALIGFCHMLIADLNSPGMVFSGKRALERRALASTLLDGHEWDEQSVDFFLEQCLAIW